MRTKSLLFAAALSLAGVASAVAQNNVYSVNAVGYVNVTVPKGFSLIANQLNSTNNTIDSLLGTPPGGTQIFKWTGTGFTSYEYFTGLGWFPDGSATLNPGEGAFINNASAAAFTVTFVGEVPQGSLVNNIPAGFSIRSSQVPQAGTMDNAGTGNLGFPSANGDQIFKWNPTSKSYDSSEYFAGLGWFPAPVSVGVGESVFVKKTTATPWTRSFSVNQ